MGKELREMLQKLEQMKVEVRALLAEDKVDEAEKRMEEVRALQKKIEVQRQLEEEERGGLGLGGAYSAGAETRAATKKDAELEQEYRQIFMKAIRRRPVSSDERSIIAEYEKRAVMNEGGANPAIPDGDSSLIVPKDIQTRINEIMRAQNDLSQYVRVEEVTTLSGSRVLEKDETMTPFALIDEYGVLPETDNPKFVAVSYSVKKRGGILPITNELLADSDQNIINYITRWIGKKAVVTRNKLITDLLLTMTPKDLADLKAVKKVFNVDLDPAISLSSIVLTNQDGYNWLDSQQDANGRFLLQDDITQPGRKLLFGRPVVVCSNRYLPSITGTTNKAPIFIGNLEELIVLFTRRFFELAATKEGGDAFKRDTTDLRTIMRDDIKFWDTGAAVYGQLALS
ncbi:phage major capsid protein [Anoxybacillus geothermalis]|uniref:phage major capsid protein n=1 Tax=Geobacillus zalihae TaxID=213419 RepID=UPI000764424C|nr:phage major capsid protein [Geobacillus zalihae]MED4922908.1 phage major capsid protein [Anoxybacillus geothermalis]